MARAKSTAVAIPDPDRSPALVAAAAAIGLDGTSWKTFRLGTTQWQTEAWRQYDICGELRYAANWMGSAISRSRLYVAEIDDKGRAGKEVTDPALAILGETVFGGPANKAEAQRLLGVQLYLTGESYIVAEEVASSSKDIWYVASNAEVKRQGDTIKVKRSNVYGGGTHELRNGRDLLIRCWTPHPQLYDAADSSVRAVLPTLREIEQLTKKVFAKIDSRLAGAGVLFVPSEVEFPRGEKDPPGIAGFQAMLGRMMSQAMTDQSSASALVPLIVKVAGEWLDKIKWQTFETPFDAETLTYRSDAVRRLALGLDMPPEVLLGQGGANHWSAWQIEESTIKLQVEPVLARIVDALTEAYLKPALTVLRVADPEKYTFWYDTSPLAIRPDRQADALALDERDLLSPAAVRKAGNWSEDDKPTQAEYERKLATKLVLLKPELLENDDIRKALGVEWAIEPAAPPGGDPMMGALPPGPGTPDAGPRALPTMPDDTVTPAQEAALLVGGDLIVRRALELHGKRLLTRSRRLSGEFASTPAHQMHTRVAVPEDELARGLDGAFTAVADLAERVGMDAVTLADMLTTYTTSLIRHGEQHDYGRFAEYMARAVQMVGHDRCGEHCLNPLHPGPCRGWTRQLGTPSGQRRDMDAPSAQPATGPAPGGGAGGRPRRPSRFPGPASNPDELTGDLGPSWWEKIPDDTGPEGIPVRNATINKSPDAPNGYDIAEGVLFRSNGIAYLIEVPEFGAPDVAGIAAAIEAVHETLPTPHRDYQHAYAWMNGRSPLDPYFATRYGITDFRAVAEAGDGSTTVWRPGDIGYDTVDEPAKATLRHEFAHNYDHGARRDGAVVHARSTDWASAGLRDNRIRNTFADFRGTPGSQWEKPSFAPLFHISVGAPVASGVNEYASRDIEEDWAESVEMYLSGRLGTARFPDGTERAVWFRDIFPTRADLLDDLFPDEAAAQIAALRQRDQP